MKKSHDGSVFRVVKIARNGYSMQSLEKHEYLDVLQVEILNDTQMIVEYGDINHDSEIPEGRQVPSDSEDCKG